MKLHSPFLLAALLASGAAQAALYDRGGGLIYDDVLNVTWLQDANYAKTSGYDATGVMTWYEAMTWVSNLDLDGITGWRLPNTIQPDPSCSNQYAGGEGYGSNCTASELGYMFYSNLGGLADQPIQTTHNTNFDLFQNIQSEFYWSQTEYTEYSVNVAWNVYMGNGYQYADYKFEPNSRFAWAVHDGDVAAVPEPKSYAMFLAGLGVMAWRLSKFKDPLNT